MSTRGGRGPRINRCALAEYRIASGLSQRNLANLAGVDASTVSRLEAGVRTMPHPRITRQLAITLGVTVNQLIEQGDGT